MVREYLQKMSRLSFVQRKMQRRAPVLLPLLRTTCARVICPYLGRLPFLAPAHACSREFMPNGKAGGFLEYSTALGLRLRSAT